MNIGVNTKGRPIYRGAKGGLYVVEKGKKIYKFKKANAPPKAPSPKLKHVSPLKRLLERVRKRRRIPYTLPGGSRVHLVFTHFDNDGKSTKRTIDVIVPEAKNEMMAVNKDTLPTQAWLNAQADYIKKLDDYDFYTAMSYTVRSHQWIGPYMRTGKLTNVRFTKPPGFIMPMVYQLSLIHI